MTITARLLRAAGLPDDTLLDDQAVQRLVLLSGERVQVHGQLSTLRDARGLTLEALATAIGCSRRAVVNYLNGSRDLTQLQWAQVQELADETA